MLKLSDGYGYVAMSPLEAAKQDIRRMIAHSCVPEDPTHAENTLQWVLKLDPAADSALQIAAIAHDIDRASNNKVQRSDFDAYDEFKAAHAKNSAKILQQILEKHRCPTVVIKKACHLVKYHEVGGDRDSDLLKDADSIAYFDYNLPFYFKREGWKETMQRCRWGYERLSPKMKTILCTIKHSEPDINRLLGEMIDTYKDV